MTPASALSVERGSFILVGEGFRRLKNASDSIYIMELEEEEPGTGGRTRRQKVRGRGKSREGDKRVEH